MVKTTGALAQMMGPETSSNYWELVDTVQKRVESSGEKYKLQGENRFSQSWRIQRLRRTMVLSGGISVADWCDVS